MTSPDPQSPAHILVVDDNRDIRDGICRYLDRNGLRSTGARSAADMDEALRGGRIDQLSGGAKQLAERVVLKPGETWVF